MGEGLEKDTEGTRGQKLSPRAVGGGEPAPTVKEQATEFAVCRDKEPPKVVQRQGTTSECAHVRQTEYTEDSESQMSGRTVLWGGHAGERR